MHDILVRVADLATGQLALVAVEMNGDEIDVGRAVPLRQALLVLQSDDRPNRFGCRRLARRFGRCIGLRLLGDRKRGGPVGGAFGERLICSQSSDSFGG